MKMRHCSIRTMYRVLGQHGKVRKRREQLLHPAYRKPERIAERPNRSVTPRAIAVQCAD
jgi:putative transposase